MEIELPGMTTRYSFVCSCPLPKGFARRVTLHREALLVVFLAGPVYASLPAYAATLGPGLSCSVEQWMSA